MSKASGPDITDWITAISAGLAFLATAGLAYIAYKQMAQLGKQASDDSKQLDKQIEASQGMGEAVLESARAQVQPMVFAHPGMIVRGDYMSKQAIDVASTEVGFTYRLANEGSGLALNVRSGVIVDDVSVEWGAGGGMPFRALRGGEQVPAEPEQSPLLVPFQKGALPENWQVLDHQYWAEFSNVFDDRFRTVVHADPSTDAEFIRLPTLKPAS
jgi:hypothetical protein